MLKYIKQFQITMHIVYPLYLAVSLIVLYLDANKFNYEDTSNIWLSLLLALIFVCYVIALIVFVVFQVMWTYKLGKKLIEKEKADLTLWHGTWAWFIPILSYYLPLRFIKEINDSFIRRLSKKEATAFANTNHVFAVWFYVSIAAYTFEVIYNKIPQQNTLALIDINLISIILTSIMYYYGIRALKKQSELVELYTKKS
jgi:hypothetical protein